MIKKVERTSTTAWSPSEYEEPLLALGTVAGAMDASFSTKTELEIFNVDLQSSTKEMIKIASIAANARYI
jgi:protein transport protein SEC31